MEHLSVAVWSAYYKAGKFVSPSKDVQVQAGWYDWFCADRLLAGKTKRLGSIVSRITDGGKVRRYDWYVWFKNNCPLSGSLYDDFRFGRLDTGETQMTVSVGAVWNDHRYVVYGLDPLGVGHWGDHSEFSKDGDCLFATDSVSELVAWFNRPWLMDSVLKSMAVRAGASYLGLEALLEYYVYSLGWSVDQANECFMKLLEDGIIPGVVRLGKKED